MGIMGLTRCLTHFPDRDSRTDLLQAIHCIVFHAEQVSSMAYSGGLIVGRNGTSILNKDVILCNSGIRFLVTNPLRRLRQSFEKTKYNWMSRREIATKD